MEDFKYGEHMIQQTVLKNIKKYPMSDISDIIKLVYQNEFGGGHLIKDENTSLKRIQNELLNIKQIFHTSVYEDIGNGIVRLNLASLPKDVSIEAVNKCFILSAKEIKGSNCRFEKKLCELLYLCKNNKLPFTEDAMSTYINTYKNNGYPIISHSYKYKQAYSPAYRIIKKEYVYMLEPISHILKNSPNKTTVIESNGNFFDTRKLWNLT